LLAAFKFKNYGNAAKVSFHPIRSNRLGRFTAYRYSLVKCLFSVATKKVQDPRASGISAPLQQGPQIPRNAAYIGVREISRDAGASKIPRIGETDIGLFKLPSKKGCGVFWPHSLQK
jgi:hypothetical protein